jgi:hypothetical protein
MPRTNLDLFDDEQPQDPPPPRRRKPAAPSMTCAEPGCGKPLLFRCHHCDRPLCHAHLCTSLLVAHCAACMRTHHGRSSVVAPAQTEMPT